MSILNRMNMTELVALAQEIDPEAHRGIGRDELVRLLTDASPEALPQKPINKYRLRIMEFVVDHWEQVKPMLTCPARSGDSRACFNCTDVQVVECVSTNRDNLFPKDHKEKAQ